MEQWLRSIGLADRIAAFRDHGITRDLLPELTDEDLRELGLTIGERKRLRRAVAGQPAAPTPAAAVAETPAEKRPLSMMFVDLVGYTDLSERVDPEDMLDLLRRYREFCSQITVRFGGQVARTVGDGVLAYFSYPLANENDPERAVRAGLDIAAGIGAVTTADGEPLRVRVGIATGPVVIGDLLSGSPVDKHAVVGPAPNLAARLQALAAPGEVIVADETFARVRGRFVGADLGEVALRGVDGPRRAWRILRERPIGDVAALPNHAPLVGRADELAALQESWTRVLTGHGATVLVTGRPGIGKSRLVRAFLDSCAGDGGITVQIHASALDTDSPLRAVVATLRRLTGGQIADQAASQADGPEARGRGRPGAVESAQQARLRRLATLGLPERTLPVLAELLGLTPPAADDLPPEQKREETLRALTDATLAIADRQALRLVVEDLHWLDPTSLDFITRLAAGVAGRRLMLVVTAREEMRAVLPSSHTVLPLQPLPELEVLRMVGAMMEGRAVRPGLLRSIARRAEGVPLFAQELVRTLAARAGADPSLSGMEDSDEDVEFGAVVPASVHAALIARLDRTGPAKEIAQAASVFGRFCQRRTLAAVCGPLLGTGLAELDAGVETLIRAGVLAPADSRVAGKDSVTFTHAMLRDAAYNSLLRDRRRSLHLQVALALQAGEPELLAEQPERLALHLTEGGDPLAAAPLWLEAARRSLARSALTEATRTLRRAVAALPRPPDNRAVAEARIAMLALLGPALMALNGQGSPEAAEVYLEANALCQELPESPAHFPIYWGWWYFSRNIHDKRDRSSTLLSRARTRGEPELLLQAHHCSWGSQFCAAEYDRCTEHIQAGLALYDAHDCRHHARLYGNHDAKVCAHGNLAQVLWMRGQPAKALEQEGLSIAWAHGLDHAGSRVHAHDMELLHHVFRRDHRFVGERASELVRFGSDHAISDAHGKGLIFLGWARATHEDRVAGLRTLEEGFARQRATGGEEDFPLYVSLLAEVLIAAGQPGRAAELLADHEPMFSANGLAFWGSEVRRMRAEAMLADAPDRADAALTLFLEAHAIAAGQGASMLALRAAVGAARVEIARGGAPGAASRLLAAIGRVEDDGTIPELAEAHALAARLAALGAAVPVA